MADAPAQHPAPQPLTVADIMQPPVTTVEQNSHVAAAAYLMKRANATALVVTRAHTGQPIGIITDADVSRAVGDGKNPNDVRIYELMTASPTVVNTTASVRDAARLMTSRRFRHLPVMGEAGLAGIVDITDVCRALLETALSGPHAAGTGYGEATGAAAETPSGPQPGPAPHLAPARRPRPRPRADLHARLLPHLAPPPGPGTADLRRRAPAGPRQPRRPRPPVSLRQRQGRPQDRTRAAAHPQLPRPARSPGHTHLQRPKLRPGHHPGPGRTHPDPAARLRPHRRAHPAHPQHGVDTTNPTPTTQTRSSIPGPRYLARRNFGLSDTLVREGRARGKFPGAAGRRLAGLPAVAGAVAGVRASGGFCPASPGVMPCPGAGGRPGMAGWWRPAARQPDIQRVLCSR